MPLNYGNRSKKTSVNTRNLNGWILPDMVKKDMVSFFITKRGCHAEPVEAWRGKASARDPSTSCRMNRAIL